MSHKWEFPNNESGILKNFSNTVQVADANSGDLLVFGYACKVFRDDDKALQIDQGKHLIPWMGEKTLKIDRYDVRATLSDLVQYEPPCGGYQNRLDYLSVSEQRAEQLCEEERYYSLFCGEEEEMLHQEEALKRQRDDGLGYKETSYDYCVEPTCLSNDASSDKKNDEPDEAYSKPSGLKTPADMKVPDTMKLHAIIEKTAKFISTQGPPMEILIKAKQSNNPQFEFLHQNSTFNPYYKFILKEFKNGSYPLNPPSEQKPCTDQALPNFASEFLPLTKHSISVPRKKYKASTDCTYTQLITKIKKVSFPKQAIGISASGTSKEADVQDNATQNCVKTEELPRTAETNVFQTDRVDAKPSEPNVVEVKKMSTGLLMAQCYNSDTDEEIDNSEKCPVLQGEIEKSSNSFLDYAVPPKSLQNIIDKTAIYVLKNGKQFEEILKTKNDTRFKFLLPDNEYHPYYVYKATGIAPVVISSELKANVVPNTIVADPIKAEDDQSVDFIPCELDEGREVQSSSGTKPINTDLNSRNGFDASQSTTDFEPEGNNLIISECISAKTTAARDSTEKSAVRSRFDINDKGVTTDSRPVFSSSSTCENNMETSQHKRLKIAEQRVRDRLARISREKLNAVSKETELQMKRKMKAKAFLNQIKELSSNSSDAAKLPNVNVVSDAPHNLECSAASITDSLSLPSDSENPENDKKVESKSDKSSSVSPKWKKKKKKKKTKKSSYKNKKSKKRSRSPLDFDSDSSVKKDELYFQGRLPPKKSKKHRKAEK